MVAPTTFRWFWPSAAALALVGGSVAFPLEAQQVPAQAQERAWRFTIDINSKPVTDWVVMQRPESLVLTIHAQDSLGNPVTLSGFEFEVWDPRVFGVVGVTVQASQAIVQLQARRRGQTTFQIRGSRLRQWVLAELTETVLTISPAQPTEPGRPRGPGAAMKTAGGRANFAVYNHTFLTSETVFDGQFGFVAEGYFGAEFPSGLVLVGGLGFGILGADSLGTLVKPTLVELYGRVDYALMKENKVRPVVSAGVAAYRIRSGSTGGIYNTSFSLLAGGGVDVTLSPKLTGEFRIMSQQLFEVTSTIINGYVGSLWLFGAGVRTTF